MCNPENLEDKVGEGPSLLDLFLDCLRSMLVLVRRVVEVICKIVESLQARRRRNMAAGCVGNERDEFYQEVCVEGMSYSSAKAGSSSATGEMDFDSARAPRSVSSRVKYGKWNFYAVKRGRSTGIFRSWLECKR